MTSILTKVCTEVCFDTPAPATVLNFECRRTRQVDTFTQKIFKSNDLAADHDVKKAIVHLMNQRVKRCIVSSLGSPTPKGKKKKQRSKYPLKTGQKNNRGGHTTWDNLTWRDKVNRKRELVKACLLKQAIPNLAAAARFAGVNHNTVSKIFYELKLTGQVASYEYNNVKTTEQTTPLERDVTAIEEGFMTVVDLKRRHPSFSRKAILKHLHRQGFRYRLLPKNTLNPDRRTINATRVCRVISHITQAMSFSDTTVLYIDEMKFPLFQTSSRRWQHPDTKEETAVIYNRRQVDETCLVAIALCSQDKFEAVQLYQREINGWDFLYFLNTVIPQLPAGRHYTIIADNATWHTSDAVRRSKASQFLFFNEPGMFQLNLIENAFSFVRSGFRKRPIVETIEEEATNIMRIFFDCANKRRFKGLVRNHLRQLDKYLTKYQQQ